MDKEKLAEIISNIRSGIGHEDISVNITRADLDEKTGNLLIVAPDRSDKSVIIGKGGWVAGRLREELGVSGVHVEAETDLMVKCHRIKLALKALAKLKSSYTALQSLEVVLLERLKDPSRIEVSPHDGDVRVAVALSGGVDSTFSLIVAGELGLNPVALTVDPGTIILPNHIKRGVDALCRNLGVEHHYLAVDFSAFQKEALEGRFHPCGRCSKIIEAAITEHVRSYEMDTVIFGDLLATGYQSLQEVNGVLRINLPAMFAASKQEVRAVASRFGFMCSGSFGCPLLAEVHRLHPHLKRYSVQRVLRETRAGVLEPGEALDLIWTIIRD